MFSSELETYIPTEFFLLATVLVFKSFFLAQFIRNTLLQLIEIKYPGFLYCLIFPFRIEEYNMKNYFKRKSCRSCF